MPTFKLTRFRVPFGPVTDYIRGPMQSITTGSDGNLWFTLQEENCVVCITPRGMYTKFPLFSLDDVEGKRNAPGAPSPFCITTGPEGDLWFTRYSANVIGVLRIVGVSPPEGAITQNGRSTSMLSIALLMKECSTLTPNSYPRGITTGPDGNIWFTANNSEGRSGGLIGRITTTPGGAITINEFSDGLSRDFWLHGITKGPGNDNTLWFTQTQQNGSSCWGSKIGRITTSGVITEYSQGLPPESGPHGITAGPDGNLWFTNQFVDQIGRITPTGVITLYPCLRGSGQMPCNITVGRDNCLWVAGKLVEVPYGGGIARIDPRNPPTGTSTGAPDLPVLFYHDRAGLVAPTFIGPLDLPGSADPMAPTCITTGPDGNIWFANAQAEGRSSVRSYEICRIVATST